MNIIGKQKIEISLKKMSAKLNKTVLFEISLEQLIYFEFY